MPMSQQDKTDYKRRYNENKYKRINMYLLPDMKEQWEQSAKSHGVSLSEFIKIAVSAYLERDKPE